MKIKKTFLTISIAIFMVFSLSFATTDSFAYWTAGASGDTSDIATASVLTNNGTTYRAKKNNPTKEPGVDRGWASQWTVV